MMSPNKLGATITSNLTGVLDHLISHQVDVHERCFDALFSGRFGTNLAPQRAHARDAAILDDDVETATPVRGRARSHFDDPPYFPFAVLERMLGNSARDP